MAGIIAFVAGLVIGYAVYWMDSRPTVRWSLGGIQQFCAKFGKAQVDDTARILKQLRLNPDMLKSLLAMGPPDNDPEEKEIP